MPFDPGSGLVFTETIVEGPSHRPSRDQLVRCVGTPPTYSPPERGTETLASIAMRSILNNLDMIDSESLSTIPPILLEKIWKAVQRSQLDSLHLWQLFAQTPIGTRTMVRTHAVRSPDTSRALAISRHPAAAWLTALEITTSSIPTTALTSLSSLPNLRHFHMATSHQTPPDEGFTDRTLKSWAEQAAAATGAFARLRTVFLYFQGGVSKWSLAHLGAFPALDEFCAYRCRLRRHHFRAPEGWVEGPDGSFVAFQRASKRHKSSSYGGGGAPRAPLWDDAVADYLHARAAKSADPLDARPTLRVVVREHDHGWKRLMDLDRVVCLKRVWGMEERGEEEEEQGERGGARPVVRKRRMVFGGADLGEMMAG